MMAARRRARRGPKGLGRLADLALAALLIGAVAMATVLLERSNSRDLQGPARIADGDSLVVSGERVRLRGIDAPERDQHCTAPDGTRPDCGRLAARHLETLIAGRAVRCSGHETDRYGRFLGVCRPVGAPALDLNAQMVADGWALSFGDYRLAEARARAEVRGIWAWSFDRPSDWRRQNRAEMVPMNAGALWRRMKGALGWGGHNE